jgi:UDP-N-acetylglucosamine transferase subunit ALG13
LPGQHPLVVQYGSSREAHGHGEWIDFMSFDALADAMRRADVVVAHAGVGSVLLAQQCGRRPIVVPRLGRLGEAVDDHQLHFARRMEGTGILRLVEDDGDLAAAVAEELAAAPAEAAADDMTQRPPSRLALELRDYLQGLVDLRAA